MKLDMADLSGVSRKILDIPYANASPRQRLDILLPEAGEGPFPALVYFHGGGFLMGDRKDLHLERYLPFLREGWAVIPAGYRLSGEAVFPAAVLDAREAVRWLKRHGAEYQIDTERLVSIGGSAGGNLAAMIGMNIPKGKFPGEEGLAADAPEPFVIGAVDQFGPLDFKAMYAHAGQDDDLNAGLDGADSPESKYLGISIAEAPDSLCDQANPLTWAGAGMAPFLVQHGTKDLLVPFRQSEDFVAALRDKGFGDRVTFFPVDGADHDDPLFSGQEVHAQIRQFLNSLKQGKRIGVAPKLFAVPDEFPDWDHEIEEAFGGSI